MVMQRKIQGERLHEMLFQFSNGLLYIFLAEKATDNTKFSQWGKFTKKYTAFLEHMIIDDETFSCYY